ncbi:MAG: hypothetical protein HUJ61_02685, partial [Bacilli bacterium]|nr:hypothetical protein [Bacilli bacterium]
QSNPVYYVQYAFVGIKCGVAFLILKAGLSLLMKIKKKIWGIIFIVITIAVMILTEIFSLPISSIYLIILGGLVGYIILQSIDVKNRKKDLANEEESNKEETNI